MEALFNFDNTKLLREEVSDDDAYLTDHGTVATDTVNFKQGDASADFTPANEEYFSRAGAAGDFNWNTTNQCTVCAWIQPDNIGAVIDWIGKGDFGVSDDYDLSAGIQSDGSPFLGVGYNSGADYELVNFTGANLVADQWYHICIAINDTGAVVAGLADQEVRIRIWDPSANEGAGGLLNGAEETPTYTNHWEPGQGGDLFIGSVNGSYLWDGKIDKLAIYDYAMTAAQMDAVRKGDVAAAIDALILTEYNPTVSKGISFTAGVDELVLTEYNPNVGKGISFTAGLDELVLTEYNPTITLGISVSAGLDELALTEYNPTVSKGISFTTGIDELVLTEYNPTVTLEAGISVSAGLDELILTEYNPNVSKAISFTTGLDELVLTEYNAAVTLGVSFTAGLDELILTEYNATIVAGGAWTAITIQGVDAISGEVVYIVGKYK